MGYRNCCERMNRKGLPKMVYEKNIQKSPDDPEKRVLPRPMRVIVSSWGRREALDALRQFFAIAPQVDLSTNRRQRIQILPEETFEKMDKLTNGAAREREERMEVIEDEDLEDLPEELLELDEYAEEELQEEELSD